MAKRHRILEAVVIAGATAAISHAMWKHEAKQQAKMQEREDMIANQQEIKRLGAMHRIKSQHKNIHDPNNNFAATAKAKYLVDHNKANLKDLAMDDLINDEDDIELVDEEDDFDF